MSLHLQDADRRNQRRCPNWPQLVAARDAATEDPPAWREALQHFDGCSACREEALEADDLAKIKSGMQNLTEAAMKLGEAIYKAEQEKAGGADGGADDMDEPREVDDDIVDADFEDLGDDKRG